MPEGGGDIAERNVLMPLRTTRRFTHDAGCGDQLLDIPVDSIHDLLNGLIEPAPRLPKRQVSKFLWSHSVALSGSSHGAKCMAASDPGATAGRGHAPPALRQSVPRPSVPPEDRRSAYPPMKSRLLARQRPLPWR